MVSLIITHRLKVLMIDQANQVNDEVNSLKMRIRFREEGIKRLQAVVAGKLSADSHLVQEKEELLKEIEILRAQVDCNPKVTSFAMENLRLKEQVRRHVLIFRVLHALFLRVILLSR